MEGRKEGNERREGRWEGGKEGGRGFVIIMIPRYSLDIVVTETSHPHTYINIHTSLHTQDTCI